MQCVSCGFENIPGLQVCGRCQSSLLLGEVDVTPPRASGIRFRARLHRFWYVLRNNISRFARVRVNWRPILFQSIPRATLFRMVIPGLAHLRGGHKMLGWSLLVAWIVLLAGSLLTVGDYSSPLYFSGACIVHTVAVIMVFGENLGYEGLAMRLVFGMAVFFGLWFFGYGTLTWFGGRFYQPIMLDQLATSSVLANGDVIVREGPWRKPESWKRGEIVVYRVHWNMGGFANFYYAAVNGFCVDRIVGLPGEHVQTVDGRLFVNGEPLAQEYYPVGGLRSLWASGMDIHLAGEEYLIIPSTLWIAANQPQNMAAFIGNFVRVETTDVLGRVVFRLRPYSRFGRVS